MIIHFLFFEQHVKKISLFLDELIIWFSLIFKLKEVIPYGHHNNILRKLTNLSTTQNIFLDEIKELKEKKTKS